MMEGFKASMEGVTLEQQLITMDNYLEHRGGLEGYFDTMIEESKAEIDKLLEKVTKTEEMVKMRDGVEVAMIIYRPNTLES